MRLFTHTIVCAAAAMLLATFLSYVADSWFGDSTSVKGLARQFVREARRSQAFQARIEMVARSTSLKRDVIAQLIAGRLRLRQAIIYFHDANELIENTDLDLVPRYQASTDPKELGRQVLAWARNTVCPLPPEKIQRLLSDLEREYKAMFPEAKLADETWLPPMAMTATGHMKANAAAR